MTLGNPAIQNRVLNGLDQFQEPQLIGNERLTLAHSLSQRCLGQMVEFHQLLVGLRFFNRTQLGALQIFDQR